MFTFANAAWLWALPAVAVPIVIHLINRARYQTVEWAAMEILFAARKVVRRRVRMEDWLLLLLRTLAILFLILALARPEFSGVTAADTAASIERIILIDDSPSMQHTIGDTSAIAAAREAALQIAERLKIDRPQDRVSVVRLSKPTEFVPNARQLAPETAQLDKLKAALQKIEPVHTPADWAAAVRALNAVLLADVPADRPLMAYFVGDFARSEWGQTVNADLLAACHALTERHIPLTLVPVALDPPDNLAVTDLVCLDSLPIAGGPVRFEATIRRYGPALENVPLSLRVDFATAPVGRIRHVPADGETKFRFTASFADGSHALAVSVPADSYAVDDRRYLSLHVARPVQVLLVDGAPGARAYAGATDFLLTALAPNPAAKLGVKATVAGYAELTELAFENAFDVVLFANVERLTPEFLTRLDKFSRAGGGIAWFLGDGIDPVFYADLAATSPALFPARPVSTSDAPPESPMRFRVVAEAHPLMEMFSDANGLAQLARTIGIEKVWQLETVGASVTTVATVAPPDDAVSKGTFDWPLILADDGKGATAADGESRGRVAIMASSADGAWTNWPRTMSFPIFCQLLARWLAPRDFTPRTLPVGMPLRERVRAEDSMPTAEIFAPAVEGETPVPIQIEGRLVGNGEYLDFAWDGLSEPGVRRLSRQSPSRQHRQDFWAWTPTLRESDLAPVALADLLAEMQAAGIRASIESSQADWLGAHHATPIAVYLLVAIGLMLITESWLAAVSARRRA